MKLIIFLSIIIMMVACFNPDEYDPLVYLDNVTRDGIIRFTDDQIDSVMADGVNSASVSVVVSSKADLGKRKVLFKTDHGSFKNGKGDSLVVDLDSAYKATAKLVGVSVGTATVKAWIQGVEAKNKVIAILLFRAHPSKINVSVDSIALKNSYQSQTVITATLKTENQGIPSVNHPVEFFVSDVSNGSSVGHFLNGNNIATTSAAGISQIRFSGGGVTAPATLKIRALTKNSEGKYLPEAVTYIQLFKD